MFRVSKNIAIANGVLFFVVGYLFAFYYKFTTAYYVGFLVFIIFSIMLAAGYRDIRRSGVSNIFPLIFFVVTLFLSSLWSIDPYRTLFQATGLLFFICISYLVANLPDEVRFKWVMRCALIASVAVLVLFMQSEITYGAVRVISSEMKDAVGSFSNLGGAVIILCIPYLIFGLQLRIGSRFIISIGLASALIAIVMSASRAAYGLSLITIIASVVWGSKDYLRVFRNVIILAILACGIGFLLWNSMAFHSDMRRVVERFSGSAIFGGDGSAVGHSVDHGRVDMFREGGKIIANNPIFGVGYKAFSKQFQRDNGFRLISHNIIITAWTGAGILGLLTLAWLLISSVFRCWHNILTSQNAYEKLFYKATFIALIAGLIHAMARPQLSNPMFFVVLGLSLVRKKLPYSVRS